MKIIATGDWHLGNMFHGHDRLPEHKHFLNWLLEKIKESDVDGLLIAGDIFDNGNPSAASQSAYYEFLAAASEISSGLQIIIIAGNHDSANRLEAPRALLSLHNVEIRGTVGRKWVPDDHGGSWQIDYDDLMIPFTGKDGTRIIVLTVPYLRNDVIHNENYSAGVNKFIRSLTERARKRYPGTPLVMMAHMYAKGSDIAEKDASEKIIIGGQEEVSFEGWDNHPEFLISGHIHKRQHIWNTDWARYPGSVLPMSFAEIFYRHGVDLIEITVDSKIAVEFIEYEPRHRLKVLPSGEDSLTLKEMLKLIDKELQPRNSSGNLDEKFDYVTLKVKMDKVRNEDIKSLEDKVGEKNAVLCAIRKIMPQMKVSTLTGNETLQSIDDILNRNPLETLKEAFSIKHNRELSESQEEGLKSVIKNINSEL